VEARTTLSVSKFVNIPRQLSGVLESFNPNWKETLGDWHGMVVTVETPATYSHVDGFYVRCNDVRGSQWIPTKWLVEMDPRQGRLFSGGR